MSGFIPGVQGVSANNTIPGHHLKVIVRGHTQHALHKVCHTTLQRPPSPPFRCGHIHRTKSGVDGIDLYLPLNNYDEDANPCDIYWTGTPGSGGTYYYFAPAIDWENDYSPLEPEYIQKEAVDKTNEFLVRLFHNLP